MFLLAGAITLALASAVHFGVALPLGFITIHDPFSGAAIPEAVLAAIVAAGSLCVLTGIRRAWWIGVAATTMTTAARETSRPRWPSSAAGTSGLTAGLRLGKRLPAT
jgi:hypothetical protein